MITLPDVLKMHSDGTLVATKEKIFCTSLLSLLHVDIMMLCIVSYREIIYRDILIYRYIVAALDQFMYMYVSVYHVMLCSVGLSLTEQLKTRNSPPMARRVNLPKERDRHPRERDRQPRRAQRSSPSLHQGWRSLVRRTAMATQK